MNCPLCQAQNQADAVFCENCGSRLEVVCQNCGEANRLGANFCNKCGQRLLQATQVARLTTEGLGSFETYTPTLLGTKVLTSKNALEGERKQITVLFADMTGSLLLLAKHDPEEARKVLNPVIEHMMEAVGRYDGTVNQILGDGIMALFGAPVAHEDHAVRACYAALRMQESVNRYAKERGTEGVPIQIRVGLNSGEVIVGAVGNDLKMEYTATGQVVHLASRMEQMATPGSIVTTSNTLQLAEGYVKVKSLGPAVVKGMSGSMEVFEVTGAGTARTRLHAASGRGRTPFVGRDTETEQLQKALEQARRDDGQVVGVVGEPGLGKSRLLFEFLHSHSTEGCLILESDSVSYEKAVPYLPIIDLLKTYFEIRDLDDHCEIHKRVAAKLVTLDKSLESALPCFLALLDITVDDPMWQALDRFQRRERTLGAVKRLLLRETQVQPLILLFENLQWIDSETHAILECLVESLPRSRLLLLVSYRPEYQQGWSNKTYCTQLVLDPLPPKSAGEMLDSVLGNDHRLQFLKQLLIERTEGNPLFLEESIRTLLETKILAGEWGNYHLEKEVVSSEVPATVQAVLAARIDRLPGQQKHVLQAAAVIGKDVPFALLRTITESSDEELRRCIAQLHAAGFFYETGLFPDLQYTFKHALTHEVAYKSLLHERQRALHTQIVKAIETLYSTRLIEQVERLAHHAARGEVWDKALSYLRQAGAKADARSANREARSYFEQALIALGHLPESRETREQAIDLHFALHISLGALGDRERRQAHLQFGEGLANDLGDKRRLAQANVYLARQLMAEGAYGQACIACERTIEMGRTLGDHGLEISGNFYLGLTNYYLGNYSTAAEVLERNLAPFDGVAVRERFGGAAVPLATSRAALALAWAERGQFIKAVAVCRDAIHIAESVGHPFSIAMTYRGMGYVHLRRGDLHQATVTLDYALEIGRGVDNPPLYYTVSSTLGYAYALSGRSAEAILLLEDAVKHPDLAGIQESKSLRELSLSEAYLLAGRELDASAAAQRALDLARQQKERGQEGYVLQLLGEIALEKYSPDFAAAEQNYLQAVTLAEELGMRPLIARCYSGLGKLYRRRGDLQLAKNHFNSGVSMMREMDMGFWLEKAEAELEELGDAVVFQKLRGLG